VPAAYRLDGGRRATGDEVDRLVAHLVERLDAVGFFFPAEKRGSMVANLDNLLRRAPLTDADVRTLHGVVRALAEKVKGRK
jgi:tRNA/rRNA methyltransferase